MSLGTRHLLMLAAHAYLVAMGAWLAVLQCAAFWQHGHAHGSLQA